jgi:hypothetical protein
VLASGEEEREEDDEDVKRAGGEVGGGGREAGGGGREVGGGGEEEDTEGEGVYRLGGDSTTIGLVGWGIISWRKKSDSTIFYDYPFKGIVQRKLTGIENGLKR